MHCFPNKIKNYITLKWKGLTSLTEFRCELLRLLLTCFSQTIYLPPQECSIFLKRNSEKNMKPQMGLMGVPKLILKNDGTKNGFSSGFVEREKINNFFTGCPKSNLRADRTKFLNWGNSQENIWKIGLAFSDIGPLKICT